MALPALERTAERDHQVDRLGFTPAQSAMDALAAIQTEMRRHAES
jgi:hypothetical protein